MALTFPNGNMTERGGENKVPDTIKRGRRTNERILYSGVRKWLASPDWNKQTAA